MHACIYASWHALPPLKCCPVTTPTCPPLLALLQICVYILYVYIERMSHRLPVCVCLRERERERERMASSRGFGVRLRMQYCNYCVVVVGVLMVGVVVVAGGDQCRLPAVVFAFGDSNTDTGGIVAGLGYRFPLPEGRVFFQHASGRLCDGRLVIDFLCESLNTSYLSPYLEAVGSDFRNGANFAISGSTTLPRNVPFALYVQVQQFLHFKSRSLDLISQGAKGPVDDDGFRNALYLIDIGQNDLAGAFSAKLPYDQVLHQRIPLILAEIRAAIQTLYNNGARNFWIHGTGPLGCLPQKLALPRNDNSDLDESGCLRTFNNASREFNTQLGSICDAMSSQLKDARIVFTDVFPIKYDLIANFSNHGFEKPLMTCCGYGGPPYNYNPNISCIAPGYQVCEDGSKFISWDGVHYTEAANAIVASKILTTEFSRPKLTFDYFCKA